MSVNIKTPSGLVKTAGNAKSVDIATTDKVGVVKPDGSTITIDSDGTISSASKVQIATTTRLGVVKPDGLSISVDTDGTIHTMVDSALNSASTRPVSNYVVTGALNNKASKDTATTSTNGLMSSADKTKLDGIQENATATEINQKTVVLSSSGWANNQQTITDEDVTADAMIFIDYGGVSGITCEQASGSLIFKVEEVPTENITLKVGIVKGNGTASDNLIKTKTVNISSISGWTSNYKEFGWSTYGIDTSKEEVLSVGIINYTGNCILTTLIGGSKFYVLTTSTSVTPTNVQLKVIYRNK